MFKNILKFGSVSFLIMFLFIGAAFSQSAPSRMVKQFSGASKHTPNIHAGKALSNMAPATNNWTNTSKQLNNTNFTQNSAATAAQEATKRVERQAADKVRRETTKREDDVRKLKQQTDDKRRIADQKHMQRQQLQAKKAAASPASDKSTVAATTRMRWSVSKLSPGKQKDELQLAISKSERKAATKKTTGIRTQKQKISQKQRVLTTQKRTNNAVAARKAADTKALSKRKRQNQKVLKAQKRANKTVTTRKAADTKVLTKRKRQNQKALTAQRRSNKAMAARKAADAKVLTKRKRQDQKVLNAQRRTNKTMAARQAADAKVLNKKNQRVFKGKYPSKNTINTAAVAPEKKLFWGTWGDYKKITVNGREYAIIGNRYYRKHAVERMQPNKRRHSSHGSTGRRPEIYPAGSFVYGRSVAPQFVEDVISSGKRTIQGDGTFSYLSGSLQVVTDSKGVVITVITK